MKVAIFSFGLFGICISTVFFAGCADSRRVDGMGGYGGSAARARDVAGEVEYIDARAREIEVKTAAGRTHVLSYDDRTRVVYRQRSYSPANLERGDYIEARVQPERDGRSYTDTITVRESVQDRSAGRREGAGRLERIDGRVESIDPRRGTFELRDSRDRLIVVSVPFNAPRPVVDGFNRLREGDSLEIEGRRVGARFELENFL